MIHKCLKNVKKIDNFSNTFLKKDGFKVNYHFSSISMQRKKDLVRAVHNRSEPRDTILEKNGTCKFCKICNEVLKISECPEKYS